MGGKHILGFRGLKGDSWTAPRAERAVDRRRGDLTLEPDSVGKTQAKKKGIVDVEEYNEKLIQRVRERRID